MKAQGKSGVIMLRHQLATAVAKAMEQLSYGTSTRTALGMFARDPAIFRRVVGLLGPHAAAVADDHARGRIVAELRPEGPSPMEPKLIELRELVRRAGTCRMPWLELREPLAGVRPLPSRELALVALHRTRMSIIQAPVSSAGPLFDTLAIP